MLRSTRRSNRCVILGLIVGWCLTGPAKSQQPEAIRANKPQQVNELIILEWLEPDQIEPTLRVLMSPEGKTQSIPAAKALLVIDYPESIETVKKHIAQIEEIAKLRAEKVEAAAQQQIAEARAAQQQSAATNKPSSGSSADLQRELQALREDSRRLLDLLEKKAPRATGLETWENKLGLAEKSEKPQQEMFVIRPVYLNMDDAAEICQSLVQNGFCHRLTKDKGLVVVCARERFELIRQCIAELDVEPTSVMIRASVCQVNVAEYEASNIFPSPRPAPALPDPSKKGKSHEEMFQSLKEKCPSLNILAQPTMTVRDGETAVMRIVSELPVQQLTKTVDGGNIETTTFREAGAALEFTPTVSQGGLVTVQVKSELSGVADWTESNQPIINRRDLTSALHLRSGETSRMIVLGRGLPVGLHLKKPAGPPVETEAILIVTAEVLPPHQTARQEVKPNPSRK
jgi:type II secretory pathway component GspD/PulD (secretin)